MTTQTTASTARKLLAKVRGVERNYRLGLYTGRNSASTERDRAGAEAEAWRLLLAGDMPRELSGLLTEEHKTAQRLQLAVEADQARPELRARQAVTQRRVREALTLAAAEAKALDARAGL